MKKTKNPAKREKDWMGTGPSSYPILPLSKNEMTGQLIWYNNNCIILMQGFLWVNFFKKKTTTKAFCYPALPTVDGWFNFFSL